ncbi:hypothetical protein J5N97_012425 [Dioscorea zingiberensis]|uniref:Rubrerythrin diiron-binding domain-containing protein n=1 Tax=Dioscorea zingiberensis TaxID=325984 RepID=A0A9D5HHP8_9LILI|nr:hypothetical protein J5N97_012425 [Dioscorea zingiberensis]
MANGRVLSVIRRLSPSRSRIDEMEIQGIREHPWRRLREKTNPVVAEIFSLMSRDEGRDAGFLNKALSDFNLALDLGFLTMIFPFINDFFLRIFPADVYVDEIIRNAKSSRKKENKDDKEKQKFYAVGGKDKGARSFSKEVIETSFNVDSDEVLSLF